MIAALLSRAWLHIKFLLLAVALLFFGLLLPGLWIAGVPVGIVLSFLLLRHLVATNDLQRFPSTMASAYVCYGTSIVPAFLSLFCAAQIAKVAKHGPDYEVTIIGVALGFFLYPTYKLVRWGRTFQREARRTA